MYIFVSYDKGEKKEKKKKKSNNNVSPHTYITLVYSYLADGALWGYLFINDTIINTTVYTYCIQSKFI